MKCSIISIFLFFGCLAFRFSFGQTNCLDQFEQAQKAYYSGNLREVGSNLEPCIGSLPKIQQEQALRLIIISNLILKNQEEAEYAMLQLLKLNPIYETTENDPPEFIDLLQSFQRDPVISVGLIAGLNWGSYELLKSYNISEISEETEYSGKTGYQMGLTGIYHFKPKFWINLGLMVEQRKFESIDKFLDNHETHGIEKQLRMEIPVTLQYIYTKWQFKPFIEVGGAINYLLSATCNLTRYNSSLNLITPTIEYDFMDYRERINYKILTGIGLLIQMDRNILGIKFRFGYELKNQTKDGPHYDNPELILNYGFINNEFRANVYSFSLFYYTSLYKPKKK